MSLLYEFTPDERRVITAAYERYLHVVQVIADLHGLEGQLSIAPDRRGFIDPTKEQY